MNSIQNESIIKLIIKYYLKEKQEINIENEDFCLISVESLSKSEETLLKVVISISNKRIYLEDEETDFYLKKSYVDFCSQKRITYKDYSNNVNKFYHDPFRVVFREPEIYNKLDDDLKLYLELTQ